MTTAGTCSESSQTHSCANRAEPRLHVAQPYTRSLGELAVKTGEMMGYELLDWQCGQLEDWGAIGDNGMWVHPRCGGSIPRQAGKSVDGIVWATTLAAVLGYKVLWTDHNYSTTLEMRKRFRDVFGSRVGDTTFGIPYFRRKVKEVCNQTSQEYYELKNGGVIAFSTRTESAKLGFSFDVIVYDEAQKLTTSQSQTITPTLSSGDKKNPQIIYLGTPTRAGESASVFRDARADAWGGESDDLAWLEYGCDEVGDVEDESRWWEINPSLGYHTEIAAIRLGLKDLKGDPLAFAQEYLGYWTPEAAESEKPLLTEEEWEECLVGHGPRGDGRTALGVKFSPDGATYALAGAMEWPDGRAHVELIACRPTSGGTKRLADFVASRDMKACSCAVDGASGAGKLADDLAGCAAGYVLRPTADNAITAAATMLDSVRERTVTHIEGPALDLSATTSTRRPIGRKGGWGWGGDNSAPIEAAGLALWALANSKRDPNRRQEIW